MTECRVKFSWGKSLPEMASFGRYMDYMTPNTEKARLKREKRRAKKALEETENHGKENE